jgi:hypothetical protein
MPVFESPFVAFYLATYCDPTRVGIKFPEPPLHEVIALAFLQVDESGEVKMMSSVREKEGGRKETDLLVPFLTNMARSRYPLSTFQAQAFVLPVLLHRAVKYGMVLPTQVQEVEDIAPNNSFNDIFQSIGLPERPMLDVKEAYEKGNGIYVRRRLEIDVLGLALVRMRWAVAKGDLSEESHRIITPLLLKRCRERSRRMGEFIEMVDKEMLLLGGRYDDEEAYPPRDS